MKRIFALLSFVFLLSPVFGQTTPSGFPLNAYGPKYYPPYLYGGNTGMSVSYGYVEYGANGVAVPLATHDTVRVATNATITKIKFDSIAFASQHSAPLVIMADTAGDTASYVNATNGVAGKDKIWYKKTPFLGNSQVDELKFYFSGSKGHWTTVKFGANFNCGTLSGDTIHIAIKTTAGGNATASFHYDYQQNSWVLEGESTW
jgi:hypothetical protein